MDVNEILQLIYYQISPSLTPEELQYIKNSIIELNNGFKIKYGRTLLN